MSALPRISLMLSGNLRKIHGVVHSFRQVLPAVVLGLDTAIGHGEVARIGLAEFVSQIILDTRLGYTPTKWSNPVMASAAQVADAITISFKLPSRIIQDLLSQLSRNPSLPLLVGSGHKYLPISDLDHVRRLTGLGIRIMIISESIYEDARSQCPENAYIVTTSKVLCYPPNTADNMVTESWLRQFRAKDMVMFGLKNFAGVPELVADYWVNKYLANCLPIM